MSHQAVALHNSQEGIGYDQSAAYRALALTYLGANLLVLGKSEEALSPVAEAVGLYRQPHAATPDQYHAELALALTYQAAGLLALDRQEEALSPVAEAVGLYRQAHAATPHQYHAELALALTYQGAILSEKNTSAPDALPLLKEAAGLYRTAHSREYRHPRSRLVIALTSLRDGAQWIRFHIRPDGSYLKVRRAESGLVHFWYSGAWFPYVQSCVDEQAACPSAFITDGGNEAAELGWTLSRLGETLHLISAKESRNSSKTGAENPRTEEMRVRGEAVRLYRSAYASGGSRYRVNLAHSLHELAMSYEARERYQLALPLFLESAQLCLACSEADQWHREWLLTRMLASIGDQIGRLGSDEKEVLLNIRTEIVRRRRAGVDAVGVTDRKVLLAGALCDQALALQNVGEFEDALCAQTEAADYYRELLANAIGRTVDNPGTRLLSVHNSDLAFSLRGLGDIYVSSGDLAKGVMNYRQAVSSFREAMQLDAPSAGSQNRAELATTLARLAATLDSLGQHDNARAVRIEADAYGH